MRTVRALCVLLACAAFTVLTKQTTAVKPCSNKTILDIYFLVDSSGSIDTSDYHYNFDFIQKIVDGYYIGEDGAKVALLTYGSSVRPKFNLSGDPAFIRAQLQNVVYQGSTTNTHKALAYIFDKSWNTPEKGARNGSQVIILITDGKSTDPEKTLEQSERIKNAGFIIIVVGVGNGVDQNEIRAVASKPEYAITVDDYSVLDNIASATSQIACNHETPEPTSVKSCPSVVFNLYFFVDSSEIVDVNDYPYNFQFIQKIIDSSGLGVYFSLYTFATSYYYEFGSFDPAVMREKLQNVTYRGGSTNTHLALRHINHFLTDYGFYFRDLRTIFILITGGPSADPWATLDEANQIKNHHNTAVIVVGVSKNVDVNEISAIATQPEYAITVNSYTELENVASKIAEIVCNEAHRPPASQ